MSWVSWVVYSREKCLTILSNILSVQIRKNYVKRKTTTDVEKHLAEVKIDSWFSKGVSEDD